MLQLLVNWLHRCQKWERMKLAWAAGPGCSEKASTDMLYASSQPTTQTSQPTQRYCQHQSYFESRGNFTCLRKAFLHDFELELWHWQSTGEKLIVFINMNEDSLKGNIDAMLGLDGLEMTEVVHSTHPELPVPPTFQCGDHCRCHAVDGCYATPDLRVLKAVWLAIFKPGTMTILHHPQFPLAIQQILHCSLHMP